MQFTCVVIIRCVVLLWISSYEVGDKCNAAWHHNDAPWANTSKCLYILLFMTKRPRIRASLRQSAGWTAGEVADLARYVKWAGKTRERQEKRGTRAFSDLVGRAGRPRERGPEMDEGRWRRMLGAALPGVRLDSPQEKGKKLRVQMLRELLQREGRYGGNA